ncbi:MAG: hypothetical protein H0W45_12135 [Acidobacteria bacterium]|nr:hypothetical protein [Acidobacteriota bacterium]
MRKTKTEEITVNRELTEQEKNWLIRRLETLKTGKYFGGGNWVDLDTNETKELDEPFDAEFFLEQIDELRVVDKFLAEMQLVIQSSSKISRLENPKRLFVLPPKIKEC